MDGTDFHRAAEDFDQVGQTSFLVRVPGLAEVVEAEYFHQKHTKKESVLVVGQVDHILVLVQDKVVEHLESLDAAWIFGSLRIHPWDGDAESHLVQQGSLSQADVAFVLHAVHHLNDFQLVGNVHFSAPRWLLN